MKPFDDFTHIVLELFRVKTLRKMVTSQSKRFFKMIKYRIEVEYKLSMNMEKLNYKIWDVEKNTTSNG